MHEAGTVGLAVVDHRDIVRAGLAALLDGPGVAIRATASSLGGLPPGRFDVLIAGGGVDVAEAVRSARARGGVVLALVDGPVAAVPPPDGVAAAVDQTVPRAELLAAVLRTADAGPPERPAASPAVPDARLNRTEREVLALYATGVKAAAVARTVGLSTSTVTTYVSRIRRKYERVGRTARARVDLYHRAVEDGLLPIA